MAVMDDPNHANDVVWKGIELCRRGEWRQGLDVLRRVAEDDGRNAELPGLFYSYLGFGIARFDRRIREGLALCEHAVKREFYQPENYLNLARTHMVAGNRRAAVEALRAGRKIDSEHPGLAALHEELGIRRPPVIPFLDRMNPINRILGRMRHDWRGEREED